MIKLNFALVFLLQTFDSFYLFETAEAAFSQSERQVILGADAAHDEDGLSLFGYEAPANKKKFVRKRNLESNVEKEETKNEIEDFGFDDYIW